MKGWPWGLAAFLCAIGWWRHRVRREPHCFRCVTCGKAGADLDDFEPQSRKGDAYVNPERHQYGRDGHFMRRAK